MKNGSTVKVYDVLVGWYTGYERARLRSHSQWHRNIEAKTLTEAGNIALSRHQDVINPKMLAGWPQYPQYPQPEK